MILGAALATLFAIQDEEAEKVYAAVAPSVVSLENVEGSGTGVLLGEKGTILTNAHVIASPLPFVARVDVPKGKEKETVTFKKVDILGVHPQYDLALVRIDPNEHKAKLKPAKISRTKPVPGRRVYAIGNPAAGGMILTKTITDGMLSAVDRVFEGLPYLQISAQVNPGNSGGPLCDKKGEVLGLVTFKFTDAEGVGFAIPLHEFSADVFVAMKNRKADSKKAKELIDQAEKYSQAARSAAERFGPNDDRRHMNNYMACMCYRMALSHDPGNADLYYNVGMLWRTLDEDRVATAYLLRAATLKPWYGQGGDVYRELGFSLVKQSKKKEARAAWMEGIAKYPNEGGKLWEDLAIYFWDEKEFVEAAFAATVALRVGNCREKVMNGMVGQARSKMKPEEHAKLDERERNIDGHLRLLQASSDSAKKAGKDFVTKEFEEFARSYDGTQAEAAASGSNPWKKAPDDAAAWIKSRISMAKNYHNNGMTDKAIETLNDVVKKYPDHADAQEAKDLLKKWRP